MRSAASRPVRKYIRVSVGKCGATARWIARNSPCEVTPAENLGFRAMASESISSRASSEASSWSLCGRISGNTNSTSASSSAASAASARAKCARVGGLNVPLSTPKRGGRGASAPFTEIPAGARRSQRSLGSSGENSAGHITRAARSYTKLFLTQSVAPHVPEPRADAVCSVAGGICWEAIAALLAATGEFSSDRELEEQSCHRFTEPTVLGRHRQPLLFLP